MFSFPELLVLAAPLGLANGYRLGSAHRRDYDTSAINTRSLITRDPPPGWSLHVAEGNDGGGCYDDSHTARILDGYGAMDSGNRLDICLSICQGKGFKYAGVQFGTECYVSSPLTFHHYHGGHSR